MSFITYDPADGERQRLRLFDIGGGGVELHAVDAFGNTLPGGRILTIHANGTLGRMVRISDGLGILTDRKGRIQDWKG